MKLTILSKTIEIEDSFWRFIIVGGVGIITNLIVFYIVADLLKLDSNLGSILAFCVAVTQNYILNQLWSFQKDVDKGLNFKNYFQYVVLNLFGLLINLIVLNLFLLIFNPTLKLFGQFFGIVISFLLNYIGSKLFIFKKKRDNSKKNPIIEDSIVPESEKIEP
jgi:putative flippase GtrA